MASVSLAVSLPNISEGRWKFKELFAAVLGEHLPGMKSQWDKAQKNLILSQIHKEGMTGF